MVMRGSGGDGGLGGVGVSERLESFNQRLDCAKLFNSISIFMKLLTPFFQILNLEEGLKVLRNPPKAANKM